MTRQGRKETQRPAPGLSLYAGALPITGQDDGQGPAARFNRPVGVVVAPDGTSYVADQNNHTIRKVTPGGLVSTHAGIPGKAGQDDGPAASATFDGPSHLALDGEGNLFVTDYNRHTIRKITAAGTVSTVAGLPGQAGCADGPVATATFDGPSGIVAAGGDLYIVDCNSSILRCLSGGQVRTVAGTAYQTDQVDGPGPQAKFSNPIGLARDGQGRLYLADWGNSVIRMCAPDGTVSTWAGNGSRDFADGPGPAAAFYGPFGVAVDDRGNLYVTDSDNCLVRTIDPARMVSTLAGSVIRQGSADGKGPAGRFSSGLGGLALGPGGSLVVVDLGSNTLRTVSAGGEVSTLAGKAAALGCDDGPRRSASFSAPGDLAMDRAGNLFVADNLNGVIRKITGDGVVNTLAGKPGTFGHADGTGSAARFGSSLMLTVDRHGCLYVSDTDANTIRKITPGGRVSTLAGSATQPAGATDATGSDARFSIPQGLAVDDEGNLYVADTGNRVIRMITPEGQVTTYAGQACTAACTDAPDHAGARFTSPVGLCRDRQGNLFVTDDVDNTVRKIEAKGGVKVLAGQPNAGGYVDSPVGTAARFASLGKVDLDAQGNLFVPDVGTGVIRKITPHGAVTTVAGTPGVFLTAPGPLPASINLGSGLTVDRRTGTLFTTAGNAILRIQLQPPSTVASSQGQP